MRFAAGVIVASALTATAAALPNAAPRAFSARDALMFSENKNILQARSCNVFDCAVEAVTLGVLLTEVIAGNFVAAIATIIGGGQATCACLECLPVAGKALVDIGACPA